MAKYSTVIIVDGQQYSDGETPHDLGSFVCTGTAENDKIRYYEGLSKDVDKLPHYVETGSSALCLDTGDYYKYCKETDTWYQL